jgi:hypothetical protein
LQRDSEHEKRLANDQFLERARTELRTETLKAEQASFPGVDHDGVDLHLARLDIQPERGLGLGERPAGGWISWRRSAKS